MSTSSHFCRLFLLNMELLDAIQSASPSTCESTGEHDFATAERQKFAVPRNFLALRLFLQHKLSMHPCSSAKPWRAAIYNDEVSPSNQLKGQNTRKLQVWYVAFLEYGKDNLWREELWATILVVWSMLANKIPGGLSFV